MKKYFVRMATAVLAFAALAIAAKAQTTDQIEVKVPYAFVVGGKTLPAGTYRVSRANTFNNLELVLSNRENGVSVIVLSNELGNKSGESELQLRPQKPGFSFEQIAGQRVLSKIETAEHVFQIPVSKTEILQAAAKAHQGSAGSGHSGTD